MTRTLSPSLPATLPNGHMPVNGKILFLYYGLDESGEPMTLEKIGALMGVTRERIRQIRERAFEKLRESPDGRALAGFWQAA